jgi:hypothetical protein
LTPEEIPADVYGYASRAFIRAYNDTGHYISLDDMDAALRPAIATAITQLFSGAVESSPCCERHHPGDLDAALHAERLRGRAEGHAAGMKEATARAGAAWTALREPMEYQVRVEIAEELRCARSLHPRNAAWTQDMDHASQIVLRGLMRYALENRLTYPTPTMDEHESYVRMAEMLANQAPSSVTLADLGLPEMKEGL